MKVVLACPGVGHIQRGYERVTVELWKHLRGLDVRLVRGGGPWWPHEGTRVPCVHRESRVARLLGNEEAAYTLEQRTFSVGLYGLLRSSRAQVVHVHDPAVMNVLWHLRRRVGGHFRLVFTNGGWLSPEHLYRADVVHCVTPVDRDRLVAAGHPQERVEMIPYGVDLPATVAPRTGKHAVLVGALCRDKGVHVAVEAMAQLPDWRLTCLGAQTEQTASLQASARERLGDRVVFRTVAPEEVPAVLQTADVSVLPSVSEGFGMAVLEALAHGLPCLVSDLPVLRWLVGDGGLTLPAGDVQVWVNALRRLDGETLSSMATAARVRAGAFDWNALHAAYAGLYRRAVELPQRGLA